MVIIGEKSIDQLDYLSDSQTLNILIIIYPVKLERVNGILVKKRFYELKNAPSCESTDGSKIGSDTNYFKEWKKQQPVTTNVFPSPVCFF